MVESCVKQRERKTCHRFKVAGETRHAPVDAMCPPVRRHANPCNMCNPGGPSRSVELGSPKRSFTACPLQHSNGTENAYGTGVYKQMTFFLPLPRCDF